MSSTLLETSLVETLVFIALALDSLANLAIEISNQLEATIDAVTKKRKHVTKQNIYYNASNKQGLEQAKLQIKMLKNSTSQAKGRVTIILNSKEYKNAILLGT